MSAIVSVVIGLTALLLGLPVVFTIIVVNFIGGYIPYVGAFLGGGLAIIVALGDGSLPDAAIMLLVVLASNLVLENFVEPKVMGRSLDIHPLVVLVVTALGGLLGGIVGLLLAVPAYVIARSAISRFRSRGIAEMVADRARPTVTALLLTAAGPATIPTRFWRAGSPRQANHQLDRDGRSTTTDRLCRRRIALRCAVHAGVDTFILLSIRRVCSCPPGSAHWRPSRHDRS
jgi:hypothetical protein